MNIADLHIGQRVRMLDFHASEKRGVVQSIKGPRTALVIFVADISEDDDLNDYIAEEVNPAELVEGWGEL